MNLERLRLLGCLLRNAIIAAAGIVLILLVAQGGLAPHRAADPGNELLQLRNSVAFYAGIVVGSAVTLLGLARMVAGVRDIFRS